MNKILADGSIVRADGTKVSPSEKTNNSFSSVNSLRLALKQDDEEDNDMDDLDWGDGFDDESPISTTVNIPGTSVIIDEEDLNWSDEEGSDSELNSEKNDDQMRLRNQYEDIINYGNQNPDDIKESVYKLRKLVLIEGLPQETESEKKEFDKKCTLRGKIWKILLGIEDVDAEKYMSIVNKGPSDKYAKISKDTHRTFKNNETFAERVSQEKLTRALNVFAHVEENSKDGLGYVQGMNAICGAFLYVLPEVDAYYCFQKLVREHCFLYLVPDIKGVHAALKLMDQCLKYVDPSLYSYLYERSYYPELLTHPILSLGTGTPPLEELLRLWDFFFAFGIHMNVVCTVAQLVIMRDTLLHHPSPCSLFRSLPPLDSQLIITVTVQLVGQLPDDLYDLLVKHATDPDIKL